MESFEVGGLITSSRVVGCPFLFLLVVIGAEWLSTGSLQPSDILSRRPVAASGESVPWACNQRRRRI